MKNNLVVVLLVVLIGIMGGVGLLLGIGNAVQMAVLPLAEMSSQVVSEQKNLERKVDALNTRLQTIEDRLTKLDNKFSAPAVPVQQQPPQEDLNKAYDIPDAASIIVGKKDAPVTIVEFTDLQCPFCARFYPPVKATLKAYPDKVRYVIKNYPLPFHPNAMPAAKMSLAAAEQGKYIEMVEQLLDNGADVSDAKVKEYAKTLGLNYDKLKVDLQANDSKYEQQIKADISLGGLVDVRGTPTFYINGRKTNARDEAGFKAAVEAILAQK